MSLVILLSNTINNAAETVGKINTWYTNERIISLKPNNKHKPTNLMPLITFSMKTRTIPLHGNYNNKLFDFT